MIFLQGNGLDEKFNQILQGMLIKFVLDKKVVWDDFLDTCTYVYNTSIHDSTAFTPFELMFGRKAFLPIDNKSPEELLDHLSKEKDDIQAV